LFNQKIKEMRKIKIIHLGIALMTYFISTVSFAQVNRTSIDSYLTELPQKSIVKKGNVSRLLCTSKWINRQIDGSFMNGYYVTGYLTTGLDSNKVYWNNVTVKNSYGNENNFSQPRAINCLEGFTYKIPTTDFMKEGFFKDCPKEDLDLLRNIVMDPMISYFGVAYLDSLKLNIPFLPNFSDGNSVSVEFKDWGSHKIANLELTRTGVSKINGVLCALINYRSHSNVINIKTSTMEVAGLSHWWGNFWVSVTDRQLEYMTLYEDVPCKILMPGFPDQFINIHREISFQRMR
jgi:hypothetical protein